MTLKQLRTVTITEASAQLKSVSPDMLRRWCLAGRVRYFQVGPKGTYHIVESDLVRFLAQQLKGNAPADDQVDESAAETLTNSSVARPSDAGPATALNRRDISDLLPPKSERRFAVGTH